MKTTIIFIAIAILGTAALPHPFVTKNSSERVGRQVVAALKNSSTEAYVNLFPTLLEFLEIMDENAVIYGNTLGVAKAEFAARYESEILPALKESFASVISEGKKKGIDWSKVSYERIEYSTPQQNLAPVPFTIVFSSKESEYRLRIEKAFVINREWKVSTKVELI